MPGTVRPPISFGARKIQASAARQKTTAVTRSAGCQAPSPARSPSITSAAPGMGRPGSLNSTKQRRAQQAISIARLTGRPTAIQRAKERSTASSSSASPARIALGGVPMSVATPPIEPA